MEQVFAELGNRLRMEWEPEKDHILVEKNLSTFWVKPVADLVYSIRKDIGRTSQDKSGLAERVLETELIVLREDVLHCAQQGNQIIFILDNFDALLKFPDPDQVQNLLNP